MKSILLILCVFVAFRSCTSRPDTNNDTHAREVSPPGDAPVDTSLKPVSLAYQSRSSSFWEQHDLGPVVASRGSSEVPEEPLNGFFGTDHYRIQVFFETVKKDPARPDRYLLTGKTRFRKRIASFSGELLLDSLFVLNDANLQTELHPDIRQLQAATGSFRLTESGIADAGSFAGRFGIAFSSTKEGKIRLWNGGSGAPDEGAGFVFRGNWQPGSSGPGKPFVVAQNFRVIGDRVLTHFSFPDRSRGINPKYRSLGWDTLMDAEEWWNEPAR